MLCLSLRDGTNFSIPLSDSMNKPTNRSDVMEVIAHLDNRDRRVPFEKGSIIPVTLSDGRQIIVSYEPFIV